ncbi:hypothetical protein [Falsochrobactrum tianjinense]|uniref:hypothetical protein n=1 Tax=Falsochrobactrum tianjinense TaxID=2706015 RepID=UPI001C318CC9|nr:hypothetical protein [Falsochrobactrum sp. TDYN1]
MSSLFNMTFFIKLTAALTKSKTMVLLWGLATSGRLTLLIDGYKEACTSALIGCGGVAERFKAPVLKFGYGHPYLYSSILRNPRMSGFARERVRIRATLFLILLPSWVAKW